MEMGCKKTTLTEKEAVKTTLKRDTCSHLWANARFSVVLQPLLFSAYLFCAADGITAPKTGIQKTPEAHDPLLFTLTQTTTDFANAEVETNCKTQKSGMLSFAHNQNTFFERKKEYE